MTNMLAMEREDKQRILKEYRETLGKQKRVIPKYNPDDENTDDEDFEEKNGRTITSTNKFDQNKERKPSQHNNK
jgi:hypothetical protein